MSKYESKSLNHDFAYQSVNACEASPTIQVRVGYEVIKAKCEVKSCNRDDFHQWVEAIEVSQMVEDPAISIG